MSQYPNRVSTNYLENGQKHCFKLRYSGPCILVIQKTASDNGDVLLEKIHSEVLNLAGRISGPYLPPPPPPPMQNLHVSPIVVVPKTDGE